MPPSAAPASRDPALDERERLEILRTPLTAIRGYVDMLLDGDAGGLTDTQTRSLGIVGRNADKLTRLSRDLLFLARAEAGTLDLDVADVDLAEAVATAEPAARAKDVAIAVGIVEVAPLRGDRARLTQLLDNLVSNAVKFTPAGGRCRSGCASRRARRSSRSRTPASASRRTRCRCSSRASFAAGPRHRGMPGTGLGPTIARTIAEAHGGTIAVESPEGEGTRFTVSLPLAR